MVFKQTYGKIDTSVIKHKGPLPEEVKDLRKLNRMTQAEFGERLGYTRQSVINWEKNIFQAPRTLLAEMAAKRLLTRKLNTTFAAAFYDMQRRELAADHKQAMAKVAEGIAEGSLQPFTNDDKLYLANKYDDILT